MASSQCHCCEHSNLSREGFTDPVLVHLPEVFLAIFVDCKLESLFFQVVDIGRNRFVPEHVRIDEMRNADGVVFHGCDLALNFPPRKLYRLRLCFYLCSPSLQLKIKTEITPLISVNTLLFAKRKFRPKTACRSTNEKWVSLPDRRFVLCMHKFDLRWRSFLSSAG